MSPVKSAFLEYRKGGKIGIPSKDTIIQIIGIALAIIPFLLLLQQILLGRTVAENSLILVVIYGLVPSYAAAVNLKINDPDKNPYIRVESLICLMIGLVLAFVLWITSSYNSEWGPTMIQVGLELAAATIAGAGLTYENT